MKKFRKLSMAFFVALLLCVGLSVAAAAKDTVIVIDPGHGAGESGASRTHNGKTYKEEVINLKIARYLKAELETYKNVKVYLTHNTLQGSGMDREARIKVASNVKADALVSIHQNISGTGKVSGALAMVPSTTQYPNSLAYAKTARNLGTAILKQLNSQVGLTNRGWLFDDELGIILYGMKAKIPSLIIEHTFLDNASDCKKYLSSDAKLKKIAVADAAGIASCFNLKKSGSNNNTTKKNGWITTNGKKYYYVNDVMVKGTWKQISSKYYYFNADGVLQTGVFKIDGKLYLSDKNGVRQTGLVKYGSRVYLANKSGQLLTGWQTYKNKKYYFSPNKGYAWTGLQPKKASSKNRYYFDKNTGAMVTGWVKINSKQTFFFGTITGRLQKNRWVKTSGKWYYVGSDGARYYSCKKTINGKTYKFNKNGVCTNRKK